MGIARPSLKRRRTLPEASILLAAKNGSSDARDEIVRAHWDDAYRVAHLLTHDTFASEDIAQEALVAAFEALHTFDERRPFAPWVRRIAANKAIDWQRRRQARPELIDTEALPRLEESDALADELGDALIGEELLAALAGLDPRFRAPVVLRYLLDYEPKEIAEITGNDPTTVRTRLHRGLKLLHATLTTIPGDIDEQAG